MIVRGFRCRFAGAVLLAALALGVTEGVLLFYFLSSWLTLPLL